MTSDIKPFLQHIDEMLEIGVQATLVKHDYRCSYDGDRQYLTSWLELLVLLKRLIYDIDTIRTIMDNMTWMHTAQSHRYPGAELEIHKFEGTLVVHGKTHTFTPFPQ